MTDNYTQSPKWTRRQLFGTLSAAVAHLEEWGACGVMVQRADLEAWATEREELREANARLLAALAAVCDAAEFTNEDGWQWCTICNEDTRASVVIRHADDCPVLTARSLLRTP